MIPWLNYHHLRSFAAVVEEGGVTPAAERLRVSHPTISQQIHKLEEQLGLALFSREGRRLKLTEDGEMIYGYAAQIFGMGAALLEAAESRRSGRAVVGRVGIDSVLAKLIVRRLLSPMMDMHGDALRLRCTEAEREQLFPALQARQLDLVLTDAPAYVTGTHALRSRQLSASSLSLFAAPQLAEQLVGEFPGNLSHAPFLLPMAATRLRRELERWMGERQISPRVAAEVEDSGLLKALGQDGRGVFAMPSSVRDDVCAQYNVRCLGEVPEVEIRVYAITREEPVTNVAIQTLLDAHPGA